MAADPARRRARLTVDHGATAENWRRFASLGGGAEAAAVVKADGYGTGAAGAAAAMARAGAKTFFTATAAEGEAVRAVVGASPDIYVLNGPGVADLPLLAAAQLRPVLNSLDQITVWRGAGAPSPAAVHIDTGMNRLGLSGHEVAAAAAALEGAAVALVMSHFACASAPDDPMNARQRTCFVAAAEAFPAARRSLSATAGALAFPDCRFDLVRPGVGLYGSSGMDAPDQWPALAPVVRLEAPILQIRTLAPGDTVGYGATFAADRPLVCATIALGYADGYLRSASGRGYGVLAGALCPVLGRVSMDLITLDVTAAGRAAEPGAWVEMLGPLVPLDDVARAAGTSSYEVLTNLGAVARTFGECG